MSSYSVSDNLATSFEPSNTVDDFARLQTVADALIGSGRTIYFTNGVVK